MQDTAAARGSANVAPKCIFEESAETDDKRQNEDGYTRMESWSDELPNMDEISTYPIGALPAEDAPPEVWARFRISFATYQTHSANQLATVKQTVGKLQRLEREGGFICIPKGGVSH